MSQNAYFNQISFADCLPMPEHHLRDDFSTRQALEVSIFTREKSDRDCLI